MVSIYSAYLYSEAQFWWKNYNRLSWYENHSYKCSSGLLRKDLCVHYLLLHTVVCGTYIFVQLKINSSKLYVNNLYSTQIWNNPRTPNFDLWQWQSAIPPAIKGGLQFFQHDTARPQTAAQPKVFLLNQRLSTMERPHCHPIFHFHQSKTYGMNLSDNTAPPIRTIRELKKECSSRWINKNW